PVSFDPDDADSKPQPPLAKAEEWIKVELDLGGGTKTYYRDANVMPQWAGSSFYQLRYIDPVNDEAVVDIENERSEEHTSELQSRFDLVCRLLLEKKKKLK